MPKIPTYTAEGQVAIPNFPQIPLFKGSGSQMLAQGLATVSESSNQVVQVAREIKQQKDETELIKQQYSYDPEIDTIRKNVLTDPNVENPFLEFNDRASALQQTYLDGIKDPQVKQAFQRHIDKTFPTIQKEMAFEVLKLQNQQNIADLHETQDILSTAAATGTPEVRDKAISDYNASVDKARMRGTIDAVKAVDLKRGFRVSTMTKNMTALAVSDPYRLFELQRQGAYADVDAVVQQKMLESARNKIETDDKAVDARVKVAQKANEQYYLGVAMRGEVPDSELQMMVDGQHPFVTDPHLIKTIVAWNNDPISVADSKPVEAIVLNFKAMSMRSPEKILEATERARAQLDAYRTTLTKKDPSLVKAYGALQAAELTIAREERSQEGAARAVEARAQAARGEERSIENQVYTRESQQRAREHEVDRKITKDTETAIQMYKTTVPRPSVLPRLASKQRAEQQIDENQIRLLMKSGTMTPQEAVDTVNKARKEKNKIQTPTGTDPVLELVPKR
jgi:hypothetical protein